MGYSPGPSIMTLIYRGAGQVKGRNEWFIHHLVGVLEVPEVLMLEGGTGGDSLAGI
jgi:hypothetical protein